MKRKVPFGTVVLGQVKEGLGDALESLWPTFMNRIREATDIRLVNYGSGTLVTLWDKGNGEFLNEIYLGRAVHNSINEDCCDEDEKKDLLKIAADFRKLADVIESEVRTKKV